MELSSAVPHTVCVSTSGQQHSKADRWSQGWGAGEVPGSEAGNNRFERLLTGLEVCHLPILPAGSLSGRKARQVNPGPRCQAGSAALPHHACLPGTAPLVADLAHILHPCHIPSDLPLTPWVLWNPNPIHPPIHARMQGTIWDSSGNIVRNLPSTRPKPGRHAPSTAPAPVPGRPPATRPPGAPSAAPSGSRPATFVGAYGGGDDAAADNHAAAPAPGSRAAAAAGMGARGGAVLQVGPPAEDDEEEEQEEEEEELGFDEMMLMAGDAAGGQIDAEVLSTLPPSVQLDILNRMKEAQQAGEMGGGTAELGVVGWAALCWPLVKM